MLRRIAGSSLQAAYRAKTSTRCPYCGTVEAARRWYSAAPALSSSPSSSATSSSGSQRLPAATNEKDLPVIGVDSSPSSSTKKARRPFAARKAAISLTPDAVEHIKGLLEGPEPRLVRVGVKNKGCAGMSYHLEYVSKPDKFDEVVEQDGVRVVVDSKALFSIIGSEMDWQENALGAKFVFKNPNIKDACGCGESFIV